MDLLITEYRIYFLNVSCTKKKRSAPDVCARINTNISHASFTLHIISNWAADSSGKRTKSPVISTGLFPRSILVVHLLIICIFAYDFCVRFYLRIGFVTYSIRAFSIALDFSILLNEIRCDQDKQDFFLSVCRMLRRIAPTPNWNALSTEPTEEISSGRRKLWEECEQ